MAFVSCTKFKESQAEQDKAINELDSKIKKLSEKESAAEHTAGYVLQDAFGEEFAYAHQTKSM